MAAADGYITAGDVPRSTSSSRYPPTGGGGGGGGAGSASARKDYRDKTGIRTTLTRRKVYTIAGVTVGIVVIIVLIVGLVLGLKKSDDGKSTPQHVLLVCLDGFKSDYIDSQTTPNISSFFSTAVLAKGLRPPFPAQSFPSQYAMVTGLHPAWNGIVGDYFHDTTIDPQDPVSFSRINTSVVSTAGWYLGTPLWVTLQKLGISTGTVNWPGSEATIQNVNPQLELKFNKTQTDTQRVNILLKWLAGQNADGQSVTVPSFIATHFRLADANGTINGITDADNFKKVLSTVDNTFGTLMNGLKALDLINKLNIIVVSDHGLSSTEDNTKLTYYETLFPSIDLTQLNIVDNRPMAYIYPLKDSYDLSQLTKILDTSSATLSYYLKSAAPGSTHAYPAEYYNPASDRIPPLMILPNEGYTLVFKNANTTTIKKGSAGYLNSLPSMQGVFAAQGPSFVSGPTTLDAVVNAVDVYDVVVAALGVKDWDVPAGNGTVPKGLMK